MSLVVSYVNHDEVCFMADLGVSFSGGDNMYVGTTMHDCMKWQFHAFNPRDNSYDKFIPQTEALDTIYDIDDSIIVAVGSVGDAENKDIIRSWIKRQFLPLNSDELREFTANMRDQLNKYVERSYDVLIHFFGRKSVIGKYCEDISKQVLPDLNAFGSSIITDDSLSCLYTFSGFGPFDLNAIGIESDFLNRYARVICCKLEERNLLLDPPVHKYNYEGVIKKICKLNTCLTDDIKMYRFRLGL